MASTGRSALRRPAAPVPMLATLGRPPSGDDWYTEWKFDGQRGLIVAADRITVCSRNGADITSLGVILSPTRLSLVSAFLAC